MSDNNKKIKVLITGASGLLGRAFLRVLLNGEQKDKYEVLGLAFSRYEQYKDQFPLQRVDLNDQQQLVDVFHKFKPNVVIHSAAERKPDVCENDRDRVFKLNVESTETMSNLARDNNCYLVLISSDYVFDGKNAPYHPDSITNPVSFYGETKRESEIVALKSNPTNIILRVPVLYGQVETLKESAVTVVADQIKSNPKAEIDDWQIRYPTLVDDVARTVSLLILRKQETNKVEGIFHFSCTQKKTKYEMALDMAKVLGLDSSQLTAASGPPVGGAPRPYNCQLDSSATKAVLGIQQLPDTPFDVEIVSVLAPFKS
eukprot:gene7891-9263_t